MKKLLSILLISAMMLLNALSAVAQEERTEAKIPAPEFTLDFLTFVMFKNDRDFDRTAPVYRDNGQTVGYVATVFEPGITWLPIEQVMLHYQLEIGDNIWSRNDTDQRNPTAEDVPIVKHKEFWSQVMLPGDLAYVKAGYQYLHDPTHLFVDKYMGAFMLGFGWDANEIALFAGQIPDSVYEGVYAAESRSELAENNFENDDYLFALSARTRPADILIEPGLWFRWNKSEVRRPEGLLAPMLHVTGRFCPYTRFEADLVGLWGRHLRAGLDNRDVERLGLAGQLGLEVTAGPVFFDWNALALTADDGDRYDQYNSSFAYSGFSKSKTLLLSENWIRDQYDNLDERAAEQEAGLFLIDQEIRVSLTQDIALLQITGFGAVLDTTQTDGESVLGTEVDAGLEWALYGRHVTFLLVGGGVFPGGAGSMLQNEIDQNSDDPVAHVQGAMELSF